MIRYTYDVELGENTRAFGGVYSEEHDIVKRLEPGHNVMFEYNTHKKAELARSSILGMAKRNGKNIRTIVDGVKVIVVAL